MLDIKKTFDPLFSLNLEFKQNAGNRALFVKQVRLFDIR
jgi:hypothetical protein